MTPPGRSTRCRLPAAAMLAALALVGCAVPPAPVATPEPENPPAATETAPAAAPTPAPPSTPAPPPDPKPTAAPRDVTADLFIRSHRIRVTLDPTNHILRAEDTLELEVRPDRPALSGTVSLRLQLAESLKAAVNPAVGRASLRREGGTVLCEVAAAGRTLELTFVCEGAIQADLEAGEVAGHIHNRNVAGHIGKEGVFLSSGSGWYPTLAKSDAPPPTLPRFHLTAAAPRDWVLVSQGGLEKGDAPNTADGLRTWTWRPELPADSLTLWGAVRKTAERPAGRVMLACHTSEANAARAPLFLKAAEDYLSDYERLLGPYPYTRFEIVENFFSSGFAYPGFTLLSPAVIAMGERALRPGYLDHELVHNWWGNGVFVDPRDGNWCEALTSYCANYLQTAAGGPAAAAKFRADIVHRWSLAAANAPETDFPLGRFGLDAKADRQSVGYSKGAMVFHMLARKLGDGRFFAGLRRLRETRVGRPANWEDIRAAMEERPGELAAFFRQWVREAGAPQLRLDKVRVATEGRLFRVSGDIVQGDRVFELAVPIVLTTADGKRTSAVVNTNAKTKAFELLTPDRPALVEADPEFHLYRTVPPAEVPPTLSATLATGPVTVFLCRSDPAESLKAYRALTAQLAKPERIREVAAPDDVRADDLKAGSAVLLGSAARGAAAKALLADAGLPLAWEGAGFVWEGAAHAADDAAVLATAVHPARPGRFVTVYWGNGPAALARADLVPFYGGNGWLLFAAGKRTARGERPAPVTATRVALPAD